MWQRGLRELLSCSVSASLIQLPRTHHFPFIYDEVERHRATFAICIESWNYQLLGASARKVGRGPLVEVVRAETQRADQRRAIVQFARNDVRNPRLALQFAAHLHQPRID